MISHTRAGTLAMCLAACHCATPVSGKPILTAAAVRKIASACGATSGQLRKTNQPLPFADFVLPGTNVEADEANRRAVLSCLSARMPSYRYDFYSFR